MAFVIQNAILFTLLGIGFSLKVIDIGVNEKISLPPPPPISDYPKVARYIVHYSDWGALAHVSFQNGTIGYPMSRVISISDGTMSNSSGIPYVYITEKDDGARDLMHKDNKCSMTISLAAGDYCWKKQLDPEDPRCLQVMLTGLFSQVSNKSEEFLFARKALFSRHPPMKGWPKNHNWFIGKITLENIQLVDGFGGNKYPSVTDYFAANPVEKEISQPFSIA